MNPIAKKSQLKLVDRKYCSCLQKVRTNEYKKNPAGYKKTKKLLRKKEAVPLGNVYNEYAVCNRSVYHTRGMKRDAMVNCAQNYDFDALSMSALQAFAIDKNMKLKTKSGRMLSRKQLLKNIKDKNAKELERIKRGDKQMPKTMKKKQEKNK